jgi:hypothetical protein
MRCTRIAIFAAAGALGLALAVTSADARRAGVHRGSAWRVGVVDAGGGFFYGPHYGYPSYPSYWRTPTTGVYPVDPGLCYAPRAYPTPGLWWQWHWAMENIC